MAHPPVPMRVVDARGQTLFTGTDISKGQKAFLNNGLIAVSRRRSANETSNAAPA